jgi:hypothetical protein
MRPDHPLPGKEVLVPDAPIEETWHVYVHGPRTYRHKDWIRNHGFDWDGNHMCYVREWLPSKKMAEDLQEYVLGETGQTVTCSWGKGSFKGIDLTKVEKTPMIQSRKEQSLTAWEQLSYRFRERLSDLESRGKIEVDESNVWMGFICVLEDPTSRVPDRQKAVEMLGKMTGVITRRAEQQDRDRAEAQEASLEDLLEKRDGEESVDS